MSYRTEQDEEKALIELYKKQGNNKKKGCCFIRTSFHKQVLYSIYTA